MKKIALTGATSMLGIALIKECISHNIEILAIVRKQSKKIKRLPKTALLTIIECDLDELSSITIEEDQRKVDTFYHFAWSYTDKMQRNNAEYQVLNIQYTLEAVRLASRLGCENFVGAGSQAEYGRITDTMAPDSATNPDIAYGIAKYAAGKLSALLCQELNIKHIWARIFSIYGPYDNENTMVMYAIKNLIERKRPEFTKSEQRWDYLYCRDAARAFYLMGRINEKATFRQNSTTYCIGSGETKSLYEFIEIIHKKIDATLPIGIGEKEYSNNQVMSLCANIDSLRNDTGFQPKYSFEQGIEETISWYLQYKSAKETSYEKSTLN